MARIQDFNFSIDLLRAVLWQYDGATNLQSLLTAKQRWYLATHTEFWSDWVRDVFDLRTANDFGLSVWAIILGIPLQVNIGAPNPNKPTFGFGEFRKNFGHGTFGNLSSSTAGLTTEQKRLVLRLRYYQLIGRGTVPETNRFLRLLFADEGVAYVLDPGDMTFATFVFTFAPNSQLQFILEQYDLLPRPAGVGVRYIVVTRPVFGLGEFNKNFNNGTFAETR